jgi:putative ABC transport system permease protein
MTPGSRAGPARMAASVPVDSALVGLAAAVGLLVGLRAIATLSFPDLVPLLGLDPIPSETLGVVWSDQAVWPVELQGAALVRLVRVIAILILSCVTVATLNTVIVLAEASAARRREFAVRSAVGASPAVLAWALMGQVRTLTLAGVTLGTVGGVVAGLAARLTWPHALASLTGSPTTDLALGVGVVLGMTAAAHVGAAWHTTRAGRAPAALRSGGRAGTDASAVFARKALSALHVTTAATALAMAIGLAGLPRGLGWVPPDATRMTESTVRTTVIEASVTDPEAWPEVLALLSDIPGMEAESLAAPGALVGLGIRDIVVTECGQCVRGGLPAPLWSEVADHHSVAPGFFALAGVELVEGRDFHADDGRGSEPVAVVDETLARLAFEKGEPIGRRIRLGADYETWYTVVGISRNHSEVVPGADGVRRPAVFLSAFQRPPASARVLLVGTDEALTAAAAILAEGGLPRTASLADDPSRPIPPADDRSGPIPLADYRSAQAEALRWSGALSFILAGLALLLATHGTWIAALQTTRRRSTEFALRRAVGASTRAILTHVILGRLRITAWGLAGFAFFGTMALAAVNGAAAVPAPGAATYGAIAGLITVVALVASTRAAGEALRVEPARLVE